MHVTVIIAAGGSGRRFGGASPKQLVTIDGRSILERSVAIFATHPAVTDLVVALPADIVGRTPLFLGDLAKPVRVVAGGARRQDSVVNAFKAVDARADVVVIHDAARPFASADLVSRTIDAAARTGAAVAAVPARDTVKRTSVAPSGSPANGVGDRSEARIVAETLPRETIFLAQTPQAFTRAVLGHALASESAGVDATDEAALAERAGHSVAIVQGEVTNVKITTADDLPFAEALARAGQSRRTARTGVGYDLHRLVEGRPLVLGGVTIPSMRGALGHSDADVVCHAATDAILGAACLGDIGRHFPDADPQWKDASSLDLLGRAVALVRERGFAVCNVDVTVVLESPKIAGHVDLMRARVAEAIGLDPSLVSIKGKTNEGVDAVGRGEAIAAHAVALLIPNP